MDRISVGGFARRIAFALALVLLTFNPGGWSYYHWLRCGRSACWDSS